MSDLAINDVERIPRGHPAVNCSACSGFVAYGVLHTTYISDAVPDRTKKETIL